MGKLLTTEEFIVRSKCIHGERYDYSKSEYIGRNKQIILICRIHGEFSQLARAHLDGQNCQYCRVITTDEWILKARKIHTDGRYSYTKSKYSGWNTLLTVTCKYHGDFEITPHSHVSKECGCSKCLKYTPEEWIAEAVKIHGSKYDYSKTVYSGAREKVTISCKHHGDFEQVAGSHLFGCGCSSCAENGYRSDLPSDFYVYKFLDYYGFGITNDIQTRCKKHAKTFEMAGIQAELIKKYHGCGLAIRNAETEIKRTFEIVDTGLKGFRTEAIRVSDGLKLFKYLDNMLGGLNEIK